MLSVIDLLDAGTLKPEQAAWLLERVWRGASWIVGARPGGAGKTTVMSAFLAMLPEDEGIRLTNPGTGWEHCPAGATVLAYELSPGAYDAYIWGKAVRRFLELGARGCRLVANLHADTLQEARHQIVHVCGADPAHFRALQIFVPLRFCGGGSSLRRTVGRIRYAPSAAGEQAGWGILDDRPVPTARQRRIIAFCEECLRTGRRRVEEVRSAWLAWNSRSGLPEC